MKRTKLRRELFDRQDEIDRQRNELIGQLEGQLEQNIVEKQLFVMWYGDPSFFLRECSEEKIKEAANIRISPLYTE